jgi:hypothetical protein
MKPVETFAIPRKVLDIFTYAFIALGLVLSLLFRIDFIDEPNDWIRHLKNFLLTMPMYLALSLRNYADTGRFFASRKEIFSVRSFGVIFYLLVIIFLVFWINGFQFIN